MKTGERLRAGLRVNWWHGPRLTSGIVGPLVGLVYIIALPFTGLTTVILLIGYYVKQRMVIFGRRAVHTIVKA